MSAFKDMFWQVVAQNSNSQNEEIQKANQQRFLDKAREINQNAIRSVQQSQTQTQQSNPYDSQYVKNSSAGFLDSATDFVWDFISGGIDSLSTLGQIGWDKTFWDGTQTNKLLKDYSEREYLRNNYNQSATSSAKLAKKDIFSLNKASDEKLQKEEDERQKELSSYGIAQKDIEEILDTKYNWKNLYNKVETPKQMQYFNNFIENEQKQLQTEFEEVDSRIKNINQDNISNKDTLLEKARTIIMDIKDTANEKAQVNQQIFNTMMDKNMNGEEAIAYLRDNDSSFREKQDNIIRRRNERIFILEHLSTDTELNTDRGMNPIGLISKGVSLMGRGLSSAVKGAGSLLRDDTYRPFKDINKFGRTKDENLLEYIANDITNLASNSAHHIETGTEIVADMAVGSKGIGLVGKWLKGITTLGKATNMGAKLADYSAKVTNYLNSSEKMAKLSKVAGFGVKETIEDTLLWDDLFASTFEMNVPGQSKADLMKENFLFNTALGVFVKPGKSIQGVVKNLQPNKVYDVSGNLKLTPNEVELIKNGNFDVAKTSVLHRMSPHYEEPSMKKILEEKDSTYTAIHKSSSMNTLKEMNPSEVQKFDDFQESLNETMSRLNAGRQTPLDENILHNASFKGLYREGYLNADDLKGLNTQLFNSYQNTKEIASDIINNFGSNSRNKYIFTSLQDNIRNGLDIEPILKRFDSAPGKITDDAIEFIRQSLNANPKGDVVFNSSYANKYQMLNKVSSILDDIYKNDIIPNATPGTRITPIHIKDEDGIRNLVTGKIEQPESLFRTFSNNNYWSKNVAKASFSEGIQNKEIKQMFDNKGKTLIPNTGYKQLLKQNNFTTLSKEAGLALQSELSKFAIQDLEKFGIEVTEESLMNNPAMKIFKETPNGYVLDITHINPKNVSEKIKEFISNGEYPRELYQFLKNTKRQDEIIRGIKVNGVGAIIGRATRNHPSFLRKSWKGLSEMISIQRPSINSQITKESALEMIDLLKELFPNVDVVFKSLPEDVKGYIDRLDNQVVIDPDKMTAFTTVHEMTHLLVPILKEGDAKTFSQMENIIKKTDYYKDIENIYRSKGVPEDVITEEAIVHAIEDKASKILNTRTHNTFYRILHSLYKKLSDFLKSKINKKEFAEKKWLEGQAEYLADILINPQGYISTADLNGVYFSGMGLTDKKVISEFINQTIYRLNDDPEFLKLLSEAWEDINKQEAIEWVIDSIIRKTEVSSYNISREVNINIPNKNKNSSLKNINIKWKTNINIDFSNILWNYMEKFTTFSRYLNNETTAVNYIKSGIANYIPPKQYFSLVKTLKDKGYIEISDIEDMEKGGALEKKILEAMRSSQIDVILKAGNETPATLTNVLESINDIKEQDIPNLLKSEQINKVVNDYISLNLLSSLEKRTPINLKRIFALNELKRPEFIGSKLKTKEYLYNIVGTKIKETSGKIQYQKVIKTSDYKNPAKIIDKEFSYTGISKQYSAHILPQDIKKEKNVVFITGQKSSINKTLVGAKNIKTISPTELKNTITAEGFIPSNDTIYIGNVDYIQEFQDVTFTDILNKSGVKFQNVPFSISKQDNQIFVSGDIPFFSQFYDIEDIELTSVELSTPQKNLLTSNSYGYTKEYSEDLERIIKGAEDTQEYLDTLKDVGIIPVKNPLVTFNSYLSIIGGNTMLGDALRKAIRSTGIKINNPFRISDSLLRNAELENYFNALPEKDTSISSFISKINPEKDLSQYDVVISDINEMEMAYKEFLEWVLPKVDVPVLQRIADKYFYALDEDLKTFPDIIEKLIKQREKVEKLKEKLLKEEPVTNNVDIEFFNKYLDTLLDTNYSIQEIQDKAIKIAKEYPSLRENLLNSRLGSYLPSLDSYILSRQMNELINIGELNKLKEPEFKERFREEFLHNKIASTNVLNKDFPELRESIQVFKDFGVFPSKISIDTITQTLTPWELDSFKKLFKELYIGGADNVLKDEEKYQAFLSQIKSLKRKFLISETFSPNGRTKWSDVEKSVNNESTNFFSEKQNAQMGNEIEDKAEDMLYNIYDKFQESVQRQFEEIFVFNHDKELIGNILKQNSNNVAFFARNASTQLDESLLVKKRNANLSNFANGELKQNILAKSIYAKKIKEAIESSDSTLMDKILKTDTFNTILNLKYPDVSSMIDVFKSNYIDMRIGQSDFFIRQNDTDSFIVQVLKASMAVTKDKPILMTLRNSKGVTKEINLLNFPKSWKVNFVKSLKSDFTEEEIKKISELSIDNIAKIATPFLHRQAENLKKLEYDKSGYDIDNFPVTKATQYPITQEFTPKTDYSNYYRVWNFDSKVTGKPNPHFKTFYQGNPDEVNSQKELNSLVWKFKQITGLEVKDPEKVANFMKAYEMANTVVFSPNNEYGQYIKLIQENSPSGKVILEAIQDWENIKFKRIDKNTIQNDSRKGVFTQDTVLFTDSDLSVISDIIKENIQKGYIFNYLPNRLNTDKGFTSYVDNYRKEVKSFGGYENSDVYHYDKYRLFKDYRAVNLKIKEPEEIIEGDSLENVKEVIRKTRDLKKDDTVVVLTKYFQDNDELLNEYRSQYIQEKYNLDPDDFNERNWTNRNLNRDQAEMNLIEQSENIDSPIGIENFDILNERFDYDPFPKIVEDLFDGKDVSIDNDFFYGIKSEDGVLRLFNKDEYLGEYEVGKELNEEKLYHTALKYNRELQNKRIMEEFSETPVNSKNSIEDISKRDIIKELSCYY